MNKTLLIIKREFLNRVKKKSFLVATILVPLIFPAIIGSVVYFAINDAKSADVQVIRVLDESGDFNPEDTKRFKFVDVEGSLDTAKAGFRESDDYGLLHVPDFNIEDPGGFVFYSKKNPSITTIESLENRIEEIVKDKKLKAYQLDKEIVDKLQTNIRLRSINMSEGEEKANNANISYAIGYFTGFLIYMFMFVYGSQVMQGVIEEKNSKIVEVIISTVKPFQLMLGKILGVASVGLFQVLIWVVLVTALSSAMLALFGLEIPQGDELASQQNPEKVQEMLLLLGDIPLLKIILTFIFFFLGGYLLYGALFAAIGSAVDTPNEAQQFMFPIMIPLVAGFIGMSTIINNPEGSLSFWLSIIPFTSPIAMMGRIGFGVPAWELALSMLLLVLGFVFTTWFAGRIYRVGILMSGSKVNYKVLAKWFMMRN